MLRAHEIVKLWEVAAGKPLWQQAILMLAAAHPSEPLDNLALLSIGNRNARLFRMREALFGTRIEATARCPACDEPLEFGLDSEVICDPSIEPCSQHEDNICEGEDLVRFRLPHSYDLRDILPLVELEGEEAAEQELLWNCLLQYTHKGISQPPESLPEMLMEIVLEAMRKTDVHAEIRCRLNCPECEHSWVELFDIADYLWREIEARAQVVLSEVQLLAKAFGWWEGDILSLSDIRRRYYLEAING